MSKKISLSHHTVKYDHYALTYKHKIEEFAKKTKNKKILDRLASLLKIMIGKKDIFPKIMQIDGIGGKSVNVREYTAHELYILFKNEHFRNIHISPIWIGLGGKINIGTEINIFPTLAHTLFVHAVR